MRSLCAPALLLACLIPAPAIAFPVTVQSCFDEATFDQVPERPIVNDANMTQTIIDLGLLDRFVGIGGIGGVEHHLSAPPDVIEKVKAKEFSERYPTMEAILGQDPDFYFAGWRYGFNEADGITPKGLAEFGIGTYVMYESCIRIGKRPPISMDTLYADILALGQIFSISEKAEAMVADYRERVAAITERVEKAARKPRVMYCGDCNTDNPPLSIGAEGTPKLLAKMAGGENIFDDIPDSYVRVSWDAVIERDPEWIIISNHRIPTEEMIEYLTTSPVLKDVTAVKKRNFVLMTYAERSPSTRNVDALERLARAMHPDLFED
jgi:iron complex transport system substrate-binding protein